MTTTMEDTTYRIVRFFASGSRETIKEDLTREEAKEHCADEESASKTCCDVEGLILTRDKGEWFDGFEEE